MFITQSYFSVPKDVRLNSTHLIMKINSRKEFLTKDTSLPARYPLRFRKNLFIKMTVTDQPKIIDNKIKANQAQYDLNRLTAKISAYSSVDLRKYEYLTGEGVGYKPSVVD